MAAQERAVRSPDGKSARTALKRERSRATSASADGARRRSRGRPRGGRHRPAAGRAAADGWKEFKVGAAACRPHRHRAATGFGGFGGRPCRSEVAAEDLLALPKKRVEERDEESEVEEGR